MIVKRFPSLRDRRHVDKMFYLGSDDLFYERIFDHYQPTEELMTLISPMLERRAASWAVHRTDVWTHVVPGRKPSTRQLPRQGWKIHISATNTNCRDILSKVATVAIEHEVQFKFANDVKTLTLMTGKRFSRGGSGKFITIYPYTDAQFKALLEELYIALKDEIGSYILSDRRYKDSRCVYYRYGGIVPNVERNYMGLEEQTIVSPDGRKIPDRRNPYFELPEWVSDPYPVSSEDDADEPSLHNGRFSIKSALSFSNTGGVYLATDTLTGQDVVLKEARPCVELSSDGEDAVARLIQERDILQALDGLGIVPRVYTSFWDWENFYIAMEYLDATPIRETMLLGSPLLLVNPTRSHSEAYYQIFKTVFVSLLEAVDSIHSKGIVIGDLSPMNIMVDKVTETIRLIDFEGAFESASGKGKDLHTPGFRPYKKGDIRDSEKSDDLYAVGTIMLYCMFPFSAMAFVREDLFSNVLPAIVGDIGWADTPVAEVVRKLVGNEVTCKEAIELLSAAATIASPLSNLSRELLKDGSALPLARTERRLSAFVTRNYRLSNDYTLFPIDPFGKVTNPLGFGFGASGIIYALRKCGASIPPAATERYYNEIESVDIKDLAPGFLVGSAGMAWALLSTGDLETGKRFLRHANVSSLTFSHHSLYYGMAGIGMVNLAAYRILSDQRYLDMAKRLARALAERAVESDRGIHWTDDDGVRIGYGYGQSGVALFFLRLSQILGDANWLQLGRRALDYDLSFGVEAAEPGVMSFPSAPDEIHTYEPYIEEGTSGIAKVAIRYGRRDDLEKLLADAHRRYSGYAGLIYGLTGFVDVLVDAYRYSRNKVYLEWAERPLGGLLDFYVFESRKGYAVPGENLFRVSCDYATGVAGVMHTLRRRIEILPDEFCLDDLDQ